MVGIRALWDEINGTYSKGDPDALAAFFTEDAVLTMPGGRFEGRDQVREYWRGLYQAFPDGTAEMGRYAETDDFLFAEVVSRGTNTGDMTLPDGTSIPPTGKATELRHAQFMGIKNGKVAEFALYYDGLTMMTQLGLMPS